MRTNSNRFISHVPDGYKDNVRAYMREESNQRTRYFLIGLATLFIAIGTFLRFIANSLSHVASRDAESGKDIRLLVPSRNGTDLGSCWMRSKTSTSWSTNLQMLKCHEGTTTATITGNKSSDLHTRMSGGGTSGRNSNINASTSISALNAGIRRPPRYFYDYKHTNQQCGVCHGRPAIDAGTCVREATNPGFRCLPSFIITGVMKSGTGELMRWLNEHPDLQSGRGEDGTNEIHYFGDHYRKSDCPWSAYLKRFPDYGQGVEGKDRNIDTKDNRAREKYTFDKSPDYIRSADKMQQIKKMLPSVKLILLLRDPVTRAVSGFDHNCRHGRYVRLVQDLTVQTDPGTLYHTTAQPLGVNGDPLHPTEQPTDEPTAVGAGAMNNTTLTSPPTGGDVATNTSKSAIVPTAAAPPSPSSSSSSADYIIPAGTVMTRSQFVHLVGTHRWRTHRHTLEKMFRVLVYPCDPQDLHDYYFGPFDNPTASVRYPGHATSLSSLMHSSRHHSGASSSPATAANIARTFYLRKERNMTAGSAATAAASYTTTSAFHNATQAVVINKKIGVAANVGAAPQLISADLKGPSQHVTNSPIVATVPTAANRQVDKKGSDKHNIASRSGSGSGGGGNSSSTGGPSNKGYKESFPVAASKNVSHLGTKATVSTTKESLKKQNRNLRQEEAVVFNLRNDADTNVDVVEGHAEDTPRRKSTLGVDDSAENSSRRKPLSRSLSSSAPPPTASTDTPRTSSTTYTRQRDSARERNLVSPFAADEGAIGYYDEQLQWTLESFPKEQLLILFQEDMKRNTLRTLQEVLRFLRVPCYDFSAIAEFPTPGEPPQIVPNTFFGQVQYHVSKLWSGIQRFTGLSVIFSSSDLSSSQLLQKGLHADTRARLEALYAQAKKRTKHIVEKELSIDLPEDWH